uniref:Uncharacterized protein n=1 Tax=Psilocybe cubensis TaxID=181762 RepID=A0A8H8CFJ8_PSICU
MSTVLPSRDAIPQPVSLELSQSSKVLKGKHHSQIQKGELVKLTESIPGKYYDQNSDKYEYTVPAGTIVRIHDSLLTRQAIEGQARLGYDYIFSLDMDDFKYHLVAPTGISVISNPIPHTKLAILPTSSTNTREMRKDRFWKIKNVAFVREAHRAPVGKQTESGWVTVNVGDGIIIEGFPESRKVGTDFIRSENCH